MSSPANKRINKQNGEMEVNCILVWGRKNIVKELEERYTRLAFMSTRIKGGSNFSNNALSISFNRP